MSAGLPVRARLLSCWRRCACWVSSTARPRGKPGRAARAPAIAGLTEALIDLKSTRWNATYQTPARPASAGARRGHRPPGRHPLLREYFAATLSKNQPEAWQEGHRRLYQQLKDSVPHHPEGLTGLQPLYQAVVHGCQAGCINRRSMRCTATAFCVARGRAETTVPSNLGPSALTWGQWPVSSLNPGSGWRQACRQATKPGCSTKRPSVCAPWAGRRRHWNRCRLGRRCG